MPAKRVLHRPRQFLIVLDSADDRKLRQAARQQGVSMSEVLRRALREYHSRLRSDPSAAA
jgi:hypothetical protein